MKLLFTRRNHPGSYLIRVATWSEFSHVDILLPNGFVVGAVAPEGVVQTPLWRRLELASKAVVMTIPTCSSAGEAWALTQIGKPYDWLGVAGLGFHRDWQQDSDWWCSELAAMAMVKNGVEPYRKEAMNRVTQQHLFALNYPIEVLK